MYSQERAAIVTVEGKGEEELLSETQSIFQKVPPAMSYSHYVSVFSSSLESWQKWASELTSF
jgi:hypothetical protein